jgi:regulator of protease activity HflC (stomatin/prohibitin superfamily)
MVSDLTANPSPSIVHKEHPLAVYSGFLMLFLLLAILVADIAWFAYERPDDYRLVISLLIDVLAVFSMRGLFILQPNEARVLLLFGAYKGTVRISGFHWTNPFYNLGAPQGGGFARGRLQARLGQTGAADRSSVNRAPGYTRISLRARTLNGEKLKVNDKRGNPVEIAAVVVWRIEDTARALFDVDDYQNYVPIQSESALRHIANMYAYDDGDGTETTLRSNVDEVSQALRAELQERLSRAGVVVDEARLTHLAYAPEIAQVMLRRQQAEAVIAARQKIVQGAVSMVGMALAELSEQRVVELDDERRASMVSNLMVVLCSESEVHPVVNTGTLYS